MLFLDICTEIIYHLYGNFGEFLAPKTGTDWVVSFTKSGNFFCFLEMKPGTSNPNKWYGRFGKNGKKEKYLQRYYFFSGKFPSDGSSIWIFPGISGFSIQMVSAHYLTDLLMSENISEIYKWKLRPRQPPKNMKLIITLTFRLNFHLTTVDHQKF